MSATIQRLPASERGVSRWKNGGGATSEVAAWPVGSAMEDFSWRISIASVEQQGPFSAFNGRERILTVLAGRLQLDFADPLETIVLDSDSDPYAFSGGAAVDGTPLDGPVLDANLIYDPTHWRGAVTRIAAGQTQRLDGDAMVLCLALSPTELDIDGEQYALANHDALLLHGSTAECRIITGNALWFNLLQA